MAVPLYCPNCHENLGKDVENPNPAYCSNCGTSEIRNPRGYKDDPEPEPKEKPCPSNNTGVNAAGT